jgi:hypothetical protein
VRDRVHSRDYVFVNPIGTYDAMQTELAEAKRNDKGKIIGIDRFVLDRKKLAQTPELFRLPESFGDCFFSQTLIDNLRQ